MENTEVKDTPLNLFKGIKEAFHYWKWFLISVVVCVTLSVLYVWVTQPVYQVDANVLIKTESEKGGASAAMSSSELTAAARAPNFGAPIYTASAP